MIRPSSYGQDMVICLVLDLLQGNGEEIFPVLLLKAIFIDHTKLGYYLNQILMVSKMCSC